MPKYFKSIFLSNVRHLFFYAFLLLFLSISANAREVTLQWDPNSEPDLSHYVVYWGANSGDYSNNSGDIGLVTAYSCTLPDDGEIYYFAVTAVDEAGLESDYSNEVNTGSIQSGNSAPFAIAGPDQNVGEESLVYLDASGSIDPDGEIVSYQWNQVSGINVALDDPTAIQPSFYAPLVSSDGESLTFRLTVTDNEGLQSTDSCVVTILHANNPPLASAGDDQTVDEGSTVTLDGWASIDPDGDAISYEWIQVSGSHVELLNTSGVRASFQAPDISDGGAYLTFELTVTDPYGSQSKDRCIIEVLFVNESPSADAGLDQTVTPYSMVVLNGSNSTDPDDGIVSYFWTQASGAAVALSDQAAMNPSFNADSEGALTFMLTVTDSGGLQSSDVCIINVTYENQPPIADAGSDQTVNEGDTVYLDGEGSADPEESTISYFWTRSAGTPSSLSDPTSANPYFTAPLEGALNFILTVTDINGLKSSDSCIINVVHINQPPEADAGPDQHVQEGDTVILNASGSKDNDDGIASFLWTQTGGTAVTLSDSTDNVVTFVAPPVNETDPLLTFELTVTDKGGLKSTTSINITVSDNGITDFPDNVISLISDTGLPVGITVDSGGSCTSLGTVDPLPFLNESNAPDDLLYGLIDFRIKVSTPGDTAVVSIYFPEPVSEDYSWYKYDGNRGWEDFGENVAFNSDRTIVTLTLVDGGPGDEDNSVNGEIVDPSGIGLRSASTPGISTGAISSGSTGTGAGNAGGGCFIATVSSNSFRPPAGISAPSKMSVVYNVLPVSIVFLTWVVVVIVRIKYLNPRNIYPDNENRRLRD